MELNLPKYEFNIKNKNNQPYIFDRIRKDFYVLTPEEWVRQHFIEFLIREKHYPKSRIAIEVPIKINRMIKRADIIFYNREGKPELLVECKRPSAKITQKVFDQIARYNQQIKARTLLVTNGLMHYCFRVNKIEKCYDFLEEIPAYISS